MDKNQTFKLSLSLIILKADIILFIITLESHGNDDTIFQRVCFNIFITQYPTKVDNKSSNK